MSDLNKSVLGWILNNKLKTERGDPVEFHEHYFLLEPFANWHWKQVTMKSAQVGWSTLAILKTIYALSHRGYNCIYTLPTFDDVHDFVPAKVDGMINNNPVLTELLGKSDAITKKQVGNNYIWYRGTHGKKAAIMHTSDLNIYDELDACYEPGVEVLTRNDGWKRIEDVTMEDRVCVLRKDKCTVTFQKPIKVLEYDYDGDMYRFTAMQLDMGVTQNHDMWARKDGRYERVKAPDLVDIPFVMTSKGSWRDFKKDTGLVNIPHITTRRMGRPLVFKSRTVDAMAFYEFLGWYLSEGNVYKYKKNGVQRTNGDIIITQKPGYEFDKIFDCLKRLGYDPKVRTNDRGVCSIIIRDLHLALYLQRLGYGSQKRIPKRYLYNKKKYLKVMLEAMLLGDGDDRNVLTTQSKGMADDVQIIAMQLNMTASIYFEPNAKVYRVGIIQKPYRRFNAYRRSNSTGTVKKEQYKGKVYCVTVPNGIIMVRGKDKKLPIWSGNSNLDVIDLYASRLQKSKYKGEWFFSNPIRPGGIDEKYNNSDKRRWIITCTRCNKDQVLDYWKNVCKERKIYKCQGCSQELYEEDRRVGRWEAENPGAEIHGYHINQLMAPWVTAKELVYLEETKTPQYFYNMILGLPFVEKDDTVDREVILQNISLKENTQLRNALGVDVGYKHLHYVLGNHEGIFKVGTLTGDTMWQDLEKLMLKFRPMCVIDANPDPYPRRKLIPKYKGRMHACFYKHNSQRRHLIEWGTKDNNRGYVYVDRNQFISSLVYDFMDKKMTFNTNGRSPQAYVSSELDDYIKHWENIYKVTEEDRYGIPYSNWKHSGADHFVHATVYFKIALSKVPKEDDDLEERRKGAAIVILDDTIPADKIPVLDANERFDTDTWMYT